MQVEWSSFYDMTEENIKRFVPTTGGVYLLWLKLKNGKWRCYYAGKGEDLERRLLDHLSDKEPNQCIKNHIQKHINKFIYTKVGKASDRSGVEKFLYYHYSPGCNEKDPGGEPIRVNLPKIN